MNHPSEWAKLETGNYRYKVQSSIVVRDTLMAIGKAFKKGATNVVKKAAKGATEKAGKNLVKCMVVAKGTDKIQQLLLKRQS